MEIQNSIAVMAMNQSQNKLQSDLGTAMLKKSMDVTSELASAQLDMLKQMPPPISGLGSLLDVRA